MKVSARLTWAALSLIRILQPAGAEDVCDSAATAANTIRARATSNNTVDNDYIQTWWHSTGEVNTKTAVKDGNVRQSHLYSVQVMSTSDATETYYDSFVYETIPRNGQGNILIPNDPSSVTTNDDGVTIEVDIGLTMAWSSFLYATDVWLRVRRLDGYQAKADDFVIRPTTLGYETSVAGGDLFIRVPYDVNGARFSIEFNDQAYAFHDLSEDPSSGYCQNTTSTGTSYYVSEFTDSMPVMGVEPLNSLLIFASPFEEDDMIPDECDTSSLVVPEGRVTGLNITTASTVIFNPGVYYFTSTDRMLLSKSVDWIYFAPGAYVKGCVEFTTNASTIKTTGHGVLSGEQYVYQADPAVGYQNHNVDNSPVRMWKGWASDDQQTTWTINGPTLNAPPFNSMDWYGNTDALSVYASDYKQVGAFFGQTDGMEMYPGSVFTNIFYHSNDDTIKTYHSHIHASNLTVWKASTAPILQFGWYPRTLSNLTLTGIDVLHSRWNSNASNPGLIASNSINGLTSTSCADLSTSISNISISRLRAEGIAGPLFRIYWLGNVDGFVVEDVWLEGFGSEEVGIPQSFMPRMTDSAGNEVSVSGFKVEGYRVGNTSVVLGNAEPVGKLEWAAEYGVALS